MNDGLPSVEEMFRAMGLGTDQERERFRQLESLAGETSPRLAIRIGLAASTVPTSEAERSAEDAELV